MPDDLKARAIALYDQFTHVHHNRRAFMRDLAALAGGACWRRLLEALSLRKLCWRP